MRPDIRVPRQLDGRVRDYAERNDVEWRDAYRRAIEAGIERLEDEETHGLSDADVRDVLSETDHQKAEREALVAIWRYIREEGTVSPQDLRDDVHPEHTTGKENAKWWWKKLSPTVEELPGVVRESQRRYVWTGE